jgi:hypothetical protein
MDTLVPQFKSNNVTFVTDYQNARLIVDSTGGVSAAKAKPAPAPTPQPVPAK